MPNQKRGKTNLFILVLGLVLAACRSPATAPSPATTTVPSPLTVAVEPLAALEGTEWTLIFLHGDEPVEDLGATLEFLPDNYLQGEAGCNSYGANYVADGSAFDLPKLHKTSFDCALLDTVREQERAYFEALESIATYRATDDRLEFDDATSDTILTFARILPPTVDPALVDTKWTLTSLHGEDLLEGSHISLNLGLVGLGGFAGCNSYGGEYTAADEGALITDMVWQTEMECPSPTLTDQEQSYIEAIRNSAAYRLLDDRLEIDDVTSKTTLVFVRNEEFVMNPDALPGTDWRLVSLNGESLAEGSTITLGFHNDYRVVGHASCRDYLTTYQASSNGLHFVYFAMIEAGCSGDQALVEQEGEYTTALGWASSYHLLDERLEIMTEQGEVLAFDPLPATAASSPEGTTWVLSAFIEEADVESWAAPVPVPAIPLPETQITLTFENGIAGGSAGCNSYGAPFAADGSALRVETPEATAMECHDPPGIMEQEQHYLDLLERASTYYVHYNQLWLETDDRQALVFAAQAGGYGLADLVADLRAAGLAVEEGQGMVDHGFAIQGQSVLVDGKPLSVYEFADANAADTALAGVSTDEYSMTVTRSEGGMDIVTHGDWIETPHLYRQDRLIVIAGDAANVLDALDAAMGPAAQSPEPRDCSIPNAFPAEEAELIWPTLHQVQPEQAAPGEQVEVRGTGGFLYWNNECGEFRNESAKDFPLFFDGEPAGSITCYAHTCLVDLTTPAGATPGTHTISVEGGSSIDIQIR